MVAFQDYLAQVEVRKLEVGMRDTEVDVDALRNHGTNRTTAKRRLAISVDAHVCIAGVRRIVSYY